MNNLSNSALITIDVQNDFALPGAPSEISGTFQIVPNIVRLLEQFRHLQKNVIHIVRLYLSDGSNAETCRQERIREGMKIVAPGTEGAELVLSLKPDSRVRLDPEILLQQTVQQIGPQEFVIYKPRWGAFYKTPLEEFLRNRKIHSLIFCGCNFPNCPRTSLYEASERDFQSIIVSDAVSGIYEQGVHELKEIGVEVMTTSKIINLLKDT